jgi:hypothetical protein
MKRGKGKPFEKGNKGKPKGAVNKVTQDIRLKFQQLVDAYSGQQMLQDLQSLEPKDRLKTISDLSEYLIPKLARTELTGANGDEIKVRQFNIVPAK